MNQMLKKIDETLTLFREKQEIVIKKRTNAKEFIVNQAADLTRNVPLKYKTPLHMLFGRINPYYSKWIEDLRILDEHIEMLASAILFNDRSSDEFLFIKLFLQVMSSGNNEGEKTNKRKSQKPIKRDGVHYIRSNDTAKLIMEYAKKKKEVFTNVEAYHIVKSEHTRNVSKGYTDNVLSLLTKSGALKRVRRGIYIYNRNNALWY